MSSGAGSAPPTRASAACSTGSKETRRSLRPCTPRWWISVRLGDDRTLIDLPSLVAGIATIALVFGIARILAGRRVALIAAAFAALSPTLSFFAVEARAYSLAIALVAASTLVMLLVTEEGRSGRWWIAYAALSAAAMYTHYTAAFVLLAQLGWLLWLRPEARRPALLANVGAAAAFIPWVPGSSPTSTRRRGSTTSFSRP